MSQALEEQKLGEQVSQALEEQKLGEQVLQELLRHVFGKGSSGSLAAFQGDLKLAAVLRAMLRTVAEGQRT